MHQIRCRLHFSRRTAGCGPEICSCGAAAPPAGRLQNSIHLQGMDVLYFAVKLAKSIVNGNGKRR